jgi:2-oxoglutarate ferredoxin oxidoreductase subunit alpha
MNIQEFIPKQELLVGNAHGDLLIVGWGNTNGAIKSAVKQLLSEQREAAQIQIDFIHPFPKNLGDILASFKVVLVPELNNGQLIKLLKWEFPSVDFRGLNKVMGVPFKKKEIIDEALSILIGGVND